MERLFLENAYISLIKSGEELCGDQVEVKGNNLNGDFTMVLADGLGSGVKASILSTLTAKIIATMIDSKMPVEECVSTIAQTLPVCSVRQVAYSTFSIIRSCANGDVRLIQYDNPEVICLRDGKNYEYPYEEKIIAGKRITESRFPAKLGDVFIAMSDGVVHAGVGQLLNFGWERENVIEYVERKYRPDMTARAVASLVSDACRELYMDKPGDDTTVAVMRVRKRQPVNLMIGPPVNKTDDERVMQEFFSQEGKKIVCGGTTSTLVARHLGTTVKTKLDYLDPEIPPIGFIDGVDLCTEGVLTMGRVVEIAKKCATSGAYTDWIGKRDGASRIAQLLFEEATDVNLFVGRAMNPAHQNPKMSIDFSIKLRMIDDLAKYLEKMGKNVNVNYN
ncbi:MAG: SpoIIE family protein phosphatase [Anaerotruncus sp.]|nr:SpoIIE family protein phosphatase [Anaerotruncus sp.]